jgi:hypothetical protein
MKNFILILVFCFSINKSFSQEKSEIFVKTSLNGVHDFTFGSSSSFGFGTHLGFRPNFQWNQFQPYVSLGFETSSPAKRNNEISFWFDRNVRFMAGLERQVAKSEKERLWVGAGGSLARGKKVTGFERTSINGIIVSENIYRGVGSEGSLQLSLRYQNRMISEIMSFGYTIDFFFEETYIHGFSINWKLR